MPLLNEIREQEYLIRKNFKILNIASNGGGSGKLTMSEHFWCPPVYSRSPNGCLRRTAPGLASEQDRKAVILGLCQGSEEAEQVQDFAAWVGSWMSEWGCRIPWPPEVWVVPPLHVILWGPLGFWNCGNAVQHRCLMCCLLVFPWGWVKAALSLLNILWGIEAFFFFFLVPHTSWPPHRRESAPAWVHICSMFPINLSWVQRLSYRMK